MSVGFSDTLLHEPIAGSKGKSKWKRNAHVESVIEHFLEGNSTPESSHSLNIDIITCIATQCRYTLCPAGRFMTSMFGLETVNENPWGSTVGHGSA